MERALKIYEHKNNVIDHFECVRNIFTLYTSRERLTELKELPDADLICAYEHYQMKTHALQNNGLSYEEFNPEHFRGIKIPEPL